MSTPESNVDDRTAAAAETPADVETLPEPAAESTDTERAEGEDAGEVASPTWWEDVRVRLPSAHPRR